MTDFSQAEETIHTYKPTIFLDLRSCPRDSYPEVAWERNGLHQLAGSPQSSREAKVGGRKLKERSFMEGMEE